MQSAHDCSDGGLAVTLAECTFSSGGIGVEVSVPAVNGVPAPWRPAATLFGESASRIVVSVAEEAVSRVLSAAAAAGVPAAVIGRTGGSEIRIDVDGVAAVRMSVDAAEQLWATAIGQRMQSTAGAA